MKIQFLGTAAAEGIPAIFCTCENCKKARVVGGKAIRTRSQAIIDDKLLIDFPADAYIHALTYGIDYTRVSGCIITHSHADHLYSEDFMMLAPAFSALPDDFMFSVWGTAGVNDKIRGIALGRSNTKLALNIIGAFDEFEVDGYHITALPARHDPASDPVFYQIEKDGKTLLYGNDTHFFIDSVWDFWAKTKPHFDLVSLDCTNVMKPMTYEGHMSFTENLAVRDRMLEMGIADENTKFLCNHFSHNGTNSVYDEFLPIAAEGGFEITYDGMKVEI